MSYSSDDNRLDPATAEAFILAKCEALAPRLGIATAAGTLRV